MVSLIIFLSSLALLLLSSRLLVLSLVNVASAFGVSTTFLSLFLVAFGTSLPELVTTISFIRKNHMDIIVGNVFGSNLFNFLFVLPSAWLANPLKMPSHFFVELSVLGIVFLGLAFMSWLSQSSKQWLGLAFLSGYIIYIALIFYFVS